MSESTVVFHFDNTTGALIIGHTSTDHLGRPSVNYNGSVFGNALVSAQYPIWNPDYTVRIPMKQSNQVSYSQFEPTMPPQSNIAPEPDEETLYHTRVENGQFVSTAEFHMVDLDSQHLILILRPTAWPVTFIISVYLICRFVRRMWGK